MSSKADLVVLPGLVLPWRVAKGYWQLIRNGVSVSVHPYTSSFSVQLAPNWREAKKSGRYTCTQHAVDGLFEYLVDSWLLDVVMADEIDGTQDGRKKTRSMIGDYIKSLPEPSEGMKRMAGVGAEHIRGRLGLPPKNARYVLVRFFKPFIQAKWFGMGGREVGVAYFGDLEEKWTVALYDIPTTVDPAAVLLLRFEPLQDGPAFNAGRCFTWTVGIEDVAICQVLSTRVMEVFKASDPFTSKRIVGFSKLAPQEPLPPSVGEVAVKVLGEALAPVPEYQTDAWGDALAAQST
jgi:hypothetical protein